MRLTKYVTKSLHFLFWSTCALYSSYSLAAEPPSVADYRMSVVKVSTDNNSSHGAGFFIDKTGHILTNEHVVGDDLNPDIRVYGENNEHAQYEGYVVSSDEDLDLALVRIEFDSSSRYLSLKAPDEGNIGDNIFTIGHPVLRNSVESDWDPAFGVLKDIDYGDKHIKYNIKIRSGNSGGPLALRDDGAVIGIVDSHYADADDWSFAIKSDVALNWLSLQKIKLPPPLVEKFTNVLGLSEEYDEVFDLGIAAGRTSGTYSKMGADLKRLVDDHKIELNVITDKTVPDTSGSVKNVELLNNDTCCQLAFVQSDVLQHYERLGETTDVSNLRFLFPLHTEEVHVIS